MWEDVYRLYAGIVYMYMCAFEVSSVQFIHSVMSVSVTPWTAAC